jgi:hypothetical protein|tara:strand:- start:225 stop:536 length:312 start_codon:yes stop_codon:yes gene_type:complete
VDKIKKEDKMVAGLAARGIGLAVRGIGKALKASKRKARRKRLGLPKKTFMERQKSAKKAGQKRADKRAGKNTGPSTKEVMGFSGAVGGTAAAGIYAKKKKQKN